MYRKDDIIMKKLTDVKDEINAIMKEYGYEVVAYCLDERIGRNSHKRATLEFTMEPIEEKKDPEEPWNL